MKVLDKDDDKIQKICSVLRDETLEPAKQQAKEIRQKAEQEAAEIIKDGERKAAELMVQARQAMEHEKSIVQAALEHAGKQAVEMLKQDIERRLFNDELSRMVVDEMAKPRTIAQLIAALVVAVSKEGVATDLRALIPKSVSPKAVAAELVEEVLKKLKDRTVEVGQFAGGCQLRVEERKMVIDVSEDTVREMLGLYIRKELRQMIFSA